MAATTTRKPVRKIMRELQRVGRIYKVGAGYFFELFRETRDNVFITNHDGVIKRKPKVHGPFTSYAGANLAFEKARLVPYMDMDALRQGNARYNANRREYERYARA